MSGKTPNASDAKRIFIRHFDKILKPADGHDNNGVSHCKDFIVSDNHSELVELNEKLVEFAVEFMKEFNLGVKERSGVFFIEKTGAIGRPATRFKMKKDVKKSIKEKYMEESAEVFVGRVELEAVFGTCPSCNEMGSHNPVSANAVQCANCEAINKAGNIS